LKENGKKESDVLWVGRDYIKGYGETREHIAYKSSWEDFCSKANFRYDAGFGGNEIPMDLIVVGKDFWLERHEYDGSEWWEFKAMPTEPEETRGLNLLLY
jgi:hypothetical protein